MKNAWKGGVLIIILLFLAGCTVLDPPEEGEFEKVRYLYPRTEAGFWSFVSYCQQTWTWEEDLRDTHNKPELVQGPPVSYRLMSGDCDDFAVMVAYYAQEYWRYDSFVALLFFLDTDEGHALAFVRATAEAVNSEIDRCGASYPFWKEHAFFYIPIDQSNQCPAWTWWNIDGTRTLFCEWYDAVYERLAIPGG